MSMKINLLYEKCVYKNYVFSLILVLWDLQNDLLLLYFSQSKYL